MPVTCVVGLQWGDEAKGKIVDILSESHGCVVRYNGGANAGHTVVWGDRKFALSLLPTGVLKPEVLSVIGNGVVVYPPRFIEEVTKLKSAGIPVGGNLVLSEKAHVILPYHMEEEKLLESAAEGKIGTTGRGIGPCYQDKVGRRFAVRVSDLLCEKTLHERLRFIVPFKNKLLTALGLTTPFDAEALAKEYLQYGDALRPHVTDTCHLLQSRIAKNESILFEAAQGSLLDVDHGTFPYVTSSCSLPSGIWTGTGVPSRKLTRIIGIAKAYTSRVGNGPFPTEQDNATGERIRQVGREFGTVTGRPRRCGWFDAVAVRYTSTLADVDELSLMLLDVLSGHQELKIAVAYMLDGKRIEQFPGDSNKLAKCEPVYETLPGWSEDLTRIRKASELPAAARSYIDRIAALIGKPVKTVSVGPDREQTIAM